ncbi:mucin-17 [Biomphalaria pfeifferi]|uniref:Mucin-17 n=1 Tax=Biomphalaria pfeifferi TaxID=112525 RepID=A0AAD8FHA6_BIOPF|nr:mucin-17 [Biomphalaria pfeifferi]
MSYEIFTDPDLEEDGLQYEHGELTLKQIVNQFPLPAVIQSDLGFLKERRLDLSQPLFAYCTRSINKVSARSVQWVNNDPHKFHLVGEDLLIPEDYTGWFTVVNQKTRKSSLPYRRVSEMIQSNTSTFLVAGITPIKAYFMTCRNKTYKHTPHQLLTGDIIRKGNNQILKEGSQALEALYQQHIECRGVTFALFHDEKDRSVLLRTQQNGVFYPIYQEGVAMTEERTLAMQFADLIMFYPPPVMVKLLHGWVPATQCGFTGTLYLINKDVETTVVASTFIRENVVSLEIPLESDIKFKVAKTSTELKSSRHWGKAFRHCLANAPSYTKAIKVIGPESSVDIDEGSLDVEDCNLPEEQASNRQKISSYTMMKQGSKFEPVQLRKPQSDPVSRPSRLSTVSYLSRRVGVYAMDQSFSNRNLTIRRMARKNAFKLGKMKQQLPVTQPFPKTSKYILNPIPCKTPAETNCSTMDENTNPKTFYNATNVISIDDHSSDSNTVAVSATIGRPVYPNESGNQYPSDNRNPVNFPEPGSRSETSSNSYEEIDSVKVNPQQKRRSAVFHLLQGKEGIITISPRTYMDEIQDEGYGESDTDDSNTNLFLFHGSIQSQEDNDYITPSDSLSVSDDYDILVPYPPLPFGRGCYNREMLIEELKKSIPINTTVELALNSLTMAEFTTLLWHPMEEMDKLLMALIPKVGELNLQHIVLYFQSVRTKVRILTEL